ncbi:DUF6090 family protein [Cryomorphaceae bacterium 1068]|nr:DUF6090 family protein [Cryomorphaceae bacterium 1068]
MISLFRKVRKKNLQEYRFARYVLYAIGEIVLVVIGILIAIQINTANQNRQNRALERQLLRSFQTDIAASIRELDRVIEKSKITALAADSILSIHRDQSESIEPSDMGELMMTLTGYTSFASQDGTVSDILGSGNLDIIQNDSIRLALASWTSNLKLLRGWEELDKTSSIQVHNLLEQNLDIYKADPSEFLTEETLEALFSSRVFLNMTSGRYHLTSVLNEIYRDKRKDYKKLSEMIQDEI